MRIIITGAAGFIGSNLTHLLLKEGFTVVGIDNFSYGSKRNMEAFITHPNFNFIEGDIKDYAVLEEIEGQCLVHLASQKIPRYSSALVTLEDNSKMLNNVIRKSLDAGLRLLYASTSDIYGKNPKIPYSEDSDSLLGPTTVRRWSYALSKIYGEQLIQAYSQDKGLRYTIMRFFGSYGPNQNLTWWGGPQSVFIKNIIEGAPLEIHGDGTQTRTFTFIDDTIQGIFKCITNPTAVNKIYNIAANPAEEVTILQLAQIIYKIMKVSQETMNIKFVPYQTFGNYEDVMRRVPSIEKIKTELNFNPLYSLEEGLTKTIEWQRAL